MEGTPLLHARRPTYLGRRIASAIGVVVGIAGIICFAMLYGSRWQVCVLAGLGGIVALINFIEATNRKQAFAKGMMPQNNVAPMRIIGVLAVCVGMLVALTYTAIAIEDSEKLTGRSSWILVVWAFLLGKWGVFSLAFADHMSKYDCQLHTVVMTRPYSASVQEGDDGNGHVYSGLPLV
eukprot:TRINITY_DN7501_c0_g1_i1.p1 TRINITY_DN7501_c0_g1~~TRINITY_DN7501_c0_g1_i1.p1  ORF type:complete len:179 (+),score=28.90 TRINITY_DN7501_c0_g1_i1:154-690(+)